MTMERKLRAVVLLEIHLIWVFVFFMHGQSSAYHESVIDLVEALNIPHQKNVTSSMIYKLRPRTPHLTLPAEYSHFLYSNLQGSMGVHVVMRQAPRSTATVFSLSSASSPILQIISSTVDNTLRLDYQAEGRPHGSSSFHFPGTNPFSGQTWVQLAVSLEPDRLTFFVDCQEAAVLPIESENRINLDLPQDVLITLGSTLGKRNTKFNGYLKAAELSLKSYSRRPWICNNRTDTHNPDSWTESIHPHSALPSKLQAHHRLLDRSSPHLQDIQIGQRAVVRQPNRSQAVKPASQVEKLKKTIEELTHTVGMITNEKEDELQKLEERIEELASALEIYIDEKEKTRELTHTLDTIIKENQKLMKAVNCGKSNLEEQFNKECEKTESSLRDGEKNCCQTPACNRGPLQNCTEENLPDCQTPACNGGNMECPSKPCPSQNCTEENILDCQTPACNGDNRECRHQLCPHQPCKKENAPDCERYICDHTGQEDTNMERRTPA